MRASMRWPLAAAALCCGCQQLAAAQSFASCGGPKDHLSNVAIALSPDPIRKDQAFSLVVTGDLDEDHIDGILAANLEVKAFGVIDKTVSNTLTYSLSPGFAKGPQKIVIGPITLPNDPGQVIVKGQVTLKNGKGEPVMCVNVDVDVPLLKFAEPQFPLSGDQVAQPCSKPSDHLKNLHSTKSGQATTTTATLDEALSSVSVDVDLVIHAMFIKIPLKLSVPVSYTPGLKQGDWKVVSSQAGGGELQSKSAFNAVTVTGQVVVSDQKHEEVTCFSVAPSAAPAGPVGFADLVV